MPFRKRYLEKERQRFSADLADWKRNRWRQAGLSADERCAVALHAGPQNRMPSLFHHFVVPLKYILSGRLFLERPLGIGHGIAVGQVRHL